MTGRSWFDKMWKCAKLSLRLLRPGLCGSFRVSYEKMWRKTHNITELISSQQPQAPSMETWIKGSVQWLFTFLSLFLRHQVAKAFIPSAATAPSLSWWWGIGEYKKKEEAVIKDTGCGTISGWRPHPHPPRSRNMIFFSGSALLFVAWSTHTWNNKQCPTTFPCAACTWGLSWDVNKHVVEDYASCQRQSPFP